MARFYEGRGKKGQFRHGQDDYENEWGDDDRQRKRDKPARFKVVKKAIWDQ